MATLAQTDIVERIYDAALAPEQWGDVMAALKQTFNGIAAGMYVSASNDHRVLSNFFDGIHATEIASYIVQIAPGNPFESVPGLVRPGHTITDQSLERFHGRSDAFVRTEMYQEWCRPQDFRHALGGGLADVDGNVLKFSLFRPQSAGHYTPHEIAAYDQIQRHLMKAVEINRRLEAAHAGLFLRDTVLDKLRLGVVALDWMGRVLFTNAHARRMFVSRDGLYESSLRLTAAGSQPASLIEAATHRALKRRKSSTLAIARAGKSELSVNVLPATDRRSLFSVAQAHVLVLIADPEDRDLGDSDYLAQRWHLAPKEAHFALHLLQGKSITEAGEAMGLTRTSAQWYSKQLLAKLGVRRQSELMFKLMNDLPTFVYREREPPSSSPADKRIEEGPQA